MAFQLICTALLSVAAATSTLLPPLPLHDKVWHDQPSINETLQDISSLDRREAFPLSPRAPPQDFAFSILPIGDSITVGVGSDDGNGYRLYLRNMFLNDNRRVNFIGTEVSGDNNPDNRHEGYGANYIWDILNHIKGNGILNQQKRANVVLIHAGTNDNDAQRLDTGETYDRAADRLGDLIDYVLCRNANAVVLVAMLIQNKYNGTQTNLFNARVPGIVAARYMKGYKVRVVDMTSVKDGEIKDLLHPNNYGYYHMASLWYNAINNIPSQWYITGPQEPTKAGGPTEICARGKNFFIQALNGNNVAAGAHLENDPGEPMSSSPNEKVFVPGYLDKGMVAIGTGNPGSGVRFADLDGDGRNDYFWVDNASGKIKAWLNKGESAWQPVFNGGDITWGLPGSQFVEFADLNGDKRAEYIVVADGHFRVFRNDGPNGDVWLWSELPAAGQQLDQLFEGGTAGYHYFGDFNGDGRADIAIIRPNTVIDIYFNTGPSGDGFGWSPCLNKGIFQAGLVFADIDGDGRADYLVMDQDGGVKGFLNKPGGTCDMTWQPINGGGEKSVALGAAPGARVRLADLDADGKADYLIIGDDAGSVNMYKNIGEYGPAPIKPLGGYAAGVRLADINGDGRDDYLSVSDTTALLAYINGGQSGDGWLYSQQGGGLPIAFGFNGGKRHQVHLADLNGDGLDDYLLVDDENGAVQCYLNRGPSTQSQWSWTIEGLVALGAGGAGKNVRFADVNGDGRADYIFLSEGGAAKIWINAGPGDTLSNWQVMNNGAVAALGVGANPEDVHFADIDGDGLADYLWIHPDSGAVDVWFNTGPLGSALGWQSGGTIATGVGLPGRNTRFARIGTSGRADYVALEESTGAFRVWINGCSEIIGSRAGTGTCLGPPLPPQSSPEPAPTTIPAGSGCVTSPCDTCTGTSCGGCKGSSCTGCSGSGCAGCIGPNCNTCKGADCPGCRGSQCYSCTGPDCNIDGGSQGGQITCKGPLCSICVGKDCNGCRGDQCTVCEGADCQLPKAKCVGPLCLLCKGSDCDDCSGSDCETCKGSDCGSNRNDCFGLDCLFCFGSGCSGCNSDDCETCSGSNCGADHRSDGRCKGLFCNTCTGSGCGGCRGPLCSTCIGIGCAGCLIGPCSRCFGLDCLGCIGPSCSTCTGKSCGGCKGDRCTVCTGPDCVNGGNCQGEDCEPDAGRKESTCSELSTSSACRVSCTVASTGNTVTTTCNTGTCSTTSGCQIAPPTGTTTTTTNNPACPLTFFPTPTYTPGQRAGLLGDGGAGGTVAFGTFVSPTLRPSYVVRTNIITVTRTYSTTVTTGGVVGALVASAYISTTYPARGGGGIVFSRYILNYFADDTAYDDLCAPRYRSFGASATPKPAAWSDIPAALTYTSVPSAAVALSSCTYQNPAAPSVGDGGAISCPNTRLPCSVLQVGTLYCGDQDLLTGEFPLSIKPLLRCDVSATTTRVIETTSTEVQTIVTTSRV